MITALALIAVAVGIISYKQPWWGLSTIFISLPFEQIGSFNLGPGQTIKLVQLAAAGFILGMIVRILLKKHKLRYIGISKWLFGLGIWAAVPVAIINYLPLWQDYLFVVFVLVLCWCVAEAVDTVVMSKLAPVILVSASAVGVFGIYQLVGDALELPNKFTGLREAYTSLQFGFPRIHGPASEPLFYASYLLFPLTLSVGMLLAGAKKYYWLALISFALVSTNLVLTTSKGGILSALVGAALLTGLLLKQDLVKTRRLKQFLLLCLVICLVALSGLSFASWKTHNSFTKAGEIYLKSSLEFTSSPTYQERRASFISGLNLFKEKPLHGIGIGGIGYRLQAYSNDSGPRIALNNYYLEVLVEIGIVGFALFIGLLVSVFSSAKQALMKKGQTEKVYLLVLLAALIAMLLQFFSFSGFFIQNLWLIIGLLAGLSSYARVGHLQPHKR